jgi:hypothetical protein
VCAVHIGTHPEFDEFQAHYAGTLSDSLIPLEESTIMSSSCRTNAVVTRPAASAATLVPAGADIISRAITSLFQEAFAGEKDQYQIDLLDVADSVKSVRDEAAHANRVQGQALDTLTAELAAIQAAAAGSEHALSTRLEKFEGERDKRHASALQTLERGLATRLVAHEAGVASVAAKVTAVRDELERAIIALREGHVERDRASEERLAAFVWAVTGEHAALSRRLNELTDENAALREAKLATEQHLADYAVTAAGVLTALEDVRRQAAAAAEATRVAAERTECVNNFLLAHVEADEAARRRKVDGSLAARCRRVVRTLRGALRGFTGLARCQRA